MHFADSDSQRLSAALGQTWPRPTLKMIPHINDDRVYSTDHVERASNLICPFFSPRRHHPKPSRFNRDCSTFRKHMPAHCLCCLSVWYGPPKAVFFGVQERRSRSLTGSPCCEATGLTCVFLCLATILIIPCGPISLSLYGLGGHSVFVLFVMIPS